MTSLWSSNFLFGPRRFCVREGVAWVVPPFELSCAIGVIPSPFLCPLPPQGVLRRVERSHQGEIASPRASLASERDRSSRLQPTPRPLGAVHEVEGMGAEDGRGETDGAPH